MSYKIAYTESGLQLLHVPNNNIKLVYVNIGVKIGSDIETKESLEYSHFMEHLLTLLTSKKYSNGLENRNFLSQNNVRLNAENITKHTMFQFTMKTDFLDKFLDMLVNALYDYYVDEHLFINEKNSVVEELNAIISDNDYKFETFIEQSLYKNHCRSYSQRARLLNVKKTTTNDIINFFKKYYNSNNIVIGFYGNLNLTHVVKIFNNFHTKQTKNINVYRSENRFNVTLNKRVNYLKENKHNSSLKIVFNIPYKFFDKEYYNIFAILNILSYDISSILINRLRNIEGLIYDLSALMDLDENNKNLSFVYFDTNVESRKLVKVISIILEELNNLKKKNINKELIKRYKDSLKIKQMNDSVSFSPLKMLDEYVKYLLWGQKIVKFTDEYTNFSNIDEKIIKKISNKIFDIDNMYIFYNGSKNLNKEINKEINKFLSP
jgi:predicted Zn-dependent peptidase